MNQIAAIFVFVTFVGDQVAGNTERQQNTEVFGEEVALAGL